MYRPSSAAPSRACRIRSARALWNASIATVAWLKTQRSVGPEGQSSRSAVIAAASAFNTAFTVNTSFAAAFAGRSKTWAPISVFITGEAALPVPAGQLAPPLAVQYQFHCENRLVGRLSVNVMSLAAVAAVDSGPLLRTSIV